MINFKRKSYFLTILYINKEINITIIIWESFCLNISIKVRLRPVTSQEFEAQISNFYNISRHQ